MGKLIFLKLGKNRWIFLELEMGILIFIKVGMGKLIKIRNEKLIFIELGIRMCVLGIMDSQVDIFRIRDGWAG